MTETDWQMAFVPSYPIETARLRLRPFTRGDVELRSSQWQAAALQWREGRIVDALARRLRALVSDGTDPLRALSLCQDHALAAAKAHVARLLSKGSLVEVMAFDGTWWAELLVRAASDLEVTVGELRKVEFGAVAPREAFAHRALGDKAFYNIFQ